MPWSASQQRRLGYEKQLLEQYFRGNRVAWIDPTGNTKVEIRVTCTNNREYSLRIYIPYDYPSSCPQMVVSSPSSCLRKRDGTVMNFADSDNHTWDSKDMALHRFVITGQWSGQTTTRFTRSLWKVWFGWRLTKHIFVLGIPWVITCNTTRNSEQLHHLKCSCRQDSEMFDIVMLLCRKAQLK